MSSDTSSPASPTSAPRFPVRLTITAAIAFAILCGLGTWQIFRLREKEALLARVAAVSHAEPRPIQDVLAEAAAGKDVSYTRVWLDCPGLGSAPFALVYAINEGQPGSRLLSACAVAAGPWKAVLVDRGFVADSVVRLPVSNPSDRTPLHVVGVLRRPDKPTAFTPPHKPGQTQWFSRDLPAIAASLHAPEPAPYYLAAETASNPDRPELKPLPIPTNISNRHLGYVITWFGLAAALAGVWAAMVRQRMRPPL
jgi:surfeit locus 1 family protein